LAAKYLLDSTLPQPPSEDLHLGGITSGSEIEGWMQANQFGHLWRTNREPGAFGKACAEHYCSSA
jgi:hypothetical protein